MIPVADWGPFHKDCDKSEMAKRKDLRSKLKAADRRRKRRPEATAAPVAPSPTIDVTGLLIERILDDSETPRQDAVVLSALRAVLNQIPPNRPEPLELYQQILELQQREDVPARALRSAIEQLIAMANDQRQAGPGVANPFISYLSLMVS